MTKFSGVFSSCANDVDDNERDTMTRSILSMLKTQHDAIVEYAQGNFNIGRGYFTRLSLSDIEDTNTPLPQEELVVLYRRNDALQLIKIDLRSKSPTCGFVTPDNYKTILPVSIALETFPVPKKQNGAPAPK